jgi:hypothetical protein
MLVFGSASGESIVGAANQTGLKPRTSARKAIPTTPRRAAR